MEKGNGTFKLLTSCDSISHESKRSRPNFTLSRDGPLALVVCSV